MTQSAPEPTPPWSFDTRVPEGPRRALPEALPAGTLFADRFQVLEQIGRGGMGTVYRALEQSSGREVALKLLSQTASPKARARFRREGELTAALRHPGIVGIHAAGEADGIPYLAYELVPSSRTLRDALETLPRAELMALIQGTAEAVGHAHAQGVAHRDLKPENVLIDELGRPRVADFGLAREAGQERLTQTGALVGTPFYMAPEQITGQGGALGPAVDVWALGVVLYEGLTGQLPFRGEDLLSLSAHVVGEPPAPPRELNPDVPPALEAVCLTALRKDPGRRYPDASALAADLGEALAGRPPTGVASARRAWGWRGRGLAAGAGVLLVALALVAGREASDPAPPPASPVHAPSPRERSHAYLDEALQRAERSQAAGDDVLPGLRAALLRSPASSELRGQIAVAFVARGWLWAAWRVLPPPATADPRLALLREVLEEACADPPRVGAVRSAPPRLQRRVEAWLLAEGRREVALLLRARDPRNVPAAGDATSLDARQRRARQLLTAALELNRGLADPATTGLVQRLLAELEPRGARARATHAAAALAAQPRDEATVCLHAQVELEEGRYAAALARVRGLPHPRATWIRALAQLAQEGDDASRLVLEALPADDLLRHEEALRLAQRCEARALAATLEERIALLRGARREEADRLAVEASRESSRPAEGAYVTLDLYQRALDAYPLHVTALYRKGQKVYMLGDAEAGLADILTALERDPRLIADFYGTQLLVALAQRQLGGSNLEGLYREVANDTLAGRRVRTFLACSLAEFEERSEWVPQALLELDALLEEAPSLIWAYVLRAALQIRAGALLLAERDLGIVDDAAPDCSSLHFFRALLAATRGESIEALLGPLTRARELGFRFGKGGRQLMERFPALSDYLDRPEMLPFVEAPR